LVTLDHAIRRTRALRNGRGVVDTCSQSVQSTSPKDHTMRTATRTLRTVARYLIWQLPDQPFPSDHPAETRRTPADLRG
jgi:hypothetical protein